jgi:putative phosphoesterase
MRILVLGDVHSNWSALSAIDEVFDACLFVGDLVDYGSEPVPCIAWAQQNVSFGVRGNHDHAVAQRILPHGGNGFRRLAAATRPLHWDVIDPKRLRYLARLPVTQHVNLGGVSFYLVHATPRDAMDEYLTDDSEAWSMRLRNVDAEIVCVGHTHLQFHLEVDGKQLLNPGSVGQPRDGDPRAAYAIVEDGVVHLRRVEYDIDRTLRQMREAGIEPWAVALTEEVLRSGGNLSREEMSQFQ